MYVYVSCVCLAPAEGRGGPKNPWDWSYTCLFAATWLSGTKPGSSAGAPGVLSH